MTGQEVLNQDEIEALIHGVDNGAVVTDPVGSPGEAQPYDFATQARIVRSRMPTLGMINERFVRLFRISLYNMLRRTPEISPLPVETQRFADYLNTLRIPTNLNLIAVKPLRGAGLLVLEPALVFAVVDNFFGGKGRNTPTQERDFTATEYRIIQMMLKNVFADMQEAWSPVFDLSLELQKSESNPQFVNIASPTEVAVISRFQIELEGGGGGLHLVLPYSMIEPIRELLDADVQSDRDPDERWPQSLREDMEDAEVDFSLHLGRCRITVGELLNLKPGDVVSADFDGKATMLVEDIPMFRGSFGASRGQQALKLEQRIHRRANPNDSTLSRNA